MPTSPELVVPESIDEAVSALQHFGDEATVVAGAPAVTIMLQQGLNDPAAIVSIGRIEELRGIDRTDGELRLGALTTHREIELDPMMRRACRSCRPPRRARRARRRGRPRGDLLLSASRRAADPPEVISREVTRATRELWGGSPFRRAAALRHE